MENFDPENVERFMADQQVGMFLNRYRECVSSDDYDKLLALYRALQPQMTFSERYGEIEIK